jgi:PIN domain nuclease of toxin-antitoxin system
LIVADTHALLWWVISRHLLSSKAREALDSRIICVTGVTVYEISSLVHRGRVNLQTDIVTWLENVIVLPKVTLLPLTMDVAVTAAKLPALVSDPIDRVIVATALLQGVPLVTKDHKIIASGIVATIW